MIIPDDFSRIKQFQTKNIKNENIYQNVISSV
uniref:Uncharacterized protein n=1 Tax=Arundo donax TaxID=35708 RepID=A0A0A9C804_ARUDO